MDYPKQRTRSSNRTVLSRSSDLLGHIFQFLEDRAGAAQVCRRWRDVDRASRKRLTVNFSYAVTPWYVVSRFTRLEAIKIKGKPRANDFDLVPEQWGGYAAPWIQALAAARASSPCCYPSLVDFHFKRMEITDEDLAVLAEAFGNVIQVLVLVKCSGFSSFGLEVIARACRSMRVFSLDESCVQTMIQTPWLQELASPYNKLEVLDIFMSTLDTVSGESLQALLQNCKLRVLKLNEISMDIQAALDLTTNSTLEDLAFAAAPATKVTFPRSLTSFAGDLPLTADVTLGARLTGLNLLCASASHEQHLEIIKSCPSLQVFLARDIIGDVGLELVSSTCKHLRKIRVENMLKHEEHGLHITNKGLLSLATTCVNLESFSMYVNDAANSSLEAFARNCPRITDFRLGLLENAPDVTEPLDAGFASLLKSCTGLIKLAIYLKPRGLSDQGLASIGRLGRNLRWLLLGCVGDSDAGFIKLAAGCRSLRKLEMRNCPFTEAGMAYGLQNLESLRYMWCQGYKRFDFEFLHFANLPPSEWKVELMPGESYSVLCYRSLAPGHRLDYPSSVVPLQVLLACGDGSPYSYTP